jgi:hypothetical protein
MSVAEAVIVSGAVTAVREGEVFVRVSVYDPPMAAAGTVSVGAE